MFELGFWELVVVAIVALVVIGPERLPRAARIAGLWVGRARRTLVTVKQEIDRELKAEELKSILDRQGLSRPLDRILEEPARTTPAAAPEARRPDAPAADPPGR